MKVSRVSILRVLAIFSSQFLGSVKAELNYQYDAVASYDLERIPRYEV